MPAEGNSVPVTKPAQLCSKCTRTFVPDNAFFQCADCKDPASNLCKLCALDDYDDSGHDRQPCYLDPRDERITWLQAPSIETFRELVAFAQSDSEYKFPISAKRFLQSKDEELPGVPNSRLESFSDVVSEEEEDTRTRKIQNDYSLYEPLDHEKREIRIALLLQAEEDAPINLAIVRMGYPWNQRDYIALSYTWGSLDETRPIYIGHASRKVSEEEQEGLRDQVFGCTANLELALRTLRRKDQFTAVWIDAVCINQADPEERAYQVGIMQEIYANSAAVCSWLNLSKQDVVALNAIGAIGHQAQRARTQEGTAAWSEVRIVRQMLQSGQFSSSKNGEEVDIAHVVQLLSDFFGNPYFRRVWVLQEVWSAHREVFVIGLNSPAVIWQHVLFAHLFVSAAFRDRRMRVQGLIQPWQQFERSSQSSNFQRVPILRLFEGVLQEFEATDTRDKLFGLLAMGKETYDIRNLPGLIAPNYNKSVSQVFIDFTKWCILSSGTLDVLGYVTFADRSQNNANWQVPSWSLSPLSAFRSHGEKLAEIEDFRTSSDLSLSMSTLEQIAEAKTVLIFSGYRLDTIARADEMYFTQRWYDSSDLYIMNHATRTYYTGGFKYIWSRTGIGETKAKDCQPSGNDSCTCRQLFDKVLMALTTGGMRTHANCDHSKGIHRTKWYKPAEMYADFAAHWVKTQTNDLDNGGDQDMNLFCEHMKEQLLPLAEKGDSDKFSELLHNASRRKFAATTSGRVGLVPLVTKEGDVVVALLGGRAPFVLRQIESSGSSMESECWQFIGECYIHDYMQGQYVKHCVDSGTPPEQFELR